MPGARLDADRLARLERVSEAALAHLGVDELLEELLARIVEVVGVDTAAVLMLDRQTDELVARAARGLEEEVEQGVRIPLGKGFAGRVAAERQVVAIEDIDHADVLNPLLRERGIRSLLGAPLLHAGAVLGVLHVGTLERRRFSEEDARLLQLVADRAAAALDHAEAYERERRARADAERAAAALGRLERVTDAALSHLSLDDLLGELLGRVAEVLDTDTAAILMLDGDHGELRPHAAHGLEQDLRHPTVVPLGKGFAGRVAAERRPVALEDIEGADVLNPRLREQGVRSLLGVPLVLRGDVLGVLHVGTLRRRRFSDEDVRLLQLVGDRSALAIDHARAYDRAQAIAETLQRSLLPEQLPTLPGVTLAARYVPARAEADVGGDWYDVIPLKGGEIALVIGDVVGHGVAAAALMGQLRSAVRAYALEGHSPAEVVHRLNRLMRRVSPNRMATMVYALFSPDEGRLRFVNAGHIPPLLRAQDDGATFLGGEGMEPLGVVDYVGGVDSEAEIAPGSALVLCTDGVLERRREGLEDGLARLREQVGGGPAVPQDLCNRLLGADGLSSDTGDDAALLVLRSDPVEPKGVSLLLPAHPEELTNVRRLLGRWLHAVGADSGEAYDITLASTEACANAVEHAYSPDEASFRLEATHDGGEVAITVRDGGKWRPPRGEHRGRGLQIMRSFMDDVRILHDPRGTTVELRRRLAPENGR